uniref:Xanthine dehydrogenase n=1 Tax=Blastobotrys adeninivorans TaxID=409370 RepID=XDH_BLAAD|nr:RecName: Full=Xanthine dehydrogenase; Short=XD; AltName: Full=Xanthine oxidoreductase; Short=Axorp; Short=XOR [Blastobotrys adeninivorans]CCV20080.1 xanthine oxidoreductase [Blastobotrys adeninivorans]
MVDLQLHQSLGHHNFTNKLTFYVNGVKRTISNPDPRGTLLDFIRTHEGLTGTKLGCSEGGCGACTVVVASWDREQGEIIYSAVNSCIVPLVAVEGKHLITVEGIGSSNNPHPAQERIALFHGSQCGFCTPGIVMSLYALLRNTGGQPSKEQIAESFDGNLCRCTGYKPIIDAANTFSCGRPGGCCRDNASGKANGAGATVGNGMANGAAAVANGNGAAANGCCKGNGAANGCCKSNGSAATTANGDDKEVDMNKLFTPNGLPLKPYSAKTELIFPPALKKYELNPLFFGNEQKVWFRPVTKLQLLQIKHAYPESKIVGGASEIQIEIKMKAANYNISVYANDIEELKTHKYIPGKGLEFGANISLSKLEEVCDKLVHELDPNVSQIYGAILEQLKYFAGRQIRNAATPAGNIATASPISDLNPVLVAAEAVLTVESIENGEEQISMTDFFVGYRKTKLPAHGVITKIFVPETVPRNEVVMAYKQAKRKDDDIAIVTACLRLALDDDFRISKARLAYGGVGPFTTAAKGTAEFLTGKLLRRETAKEVLEGAIDCLIKEFDLPYSVPGGMAAYRRTLIMSFFYKFYSTVLEKIGLAGEAQDNSALENTYDPQALLEVTRKHPVGSRDLTNPYEQRIVGKSDPHLSALKQVTGEAVYIDDIPPYHGECFGVQVMSTKPRARILSVDPSPALEVEGVVGYVDVNDLPSREANIWGPTPVGKEPFFADGEVYYVGQCIGVIIATDRMIAEEAARLVKVEYEELETVITIEEAIEAQSFFDYQPKAEKGDVDGAFAESAYTFEGTSRIGSQEHFYLETQGSLVVPEPEDGEMKVYSSSQNPTETQVFVAQATGVPSSRIVARVKRLGGGFGGKESRCCHLSSIAAVAAKKYKRPVRMILSRSEDMLTAGQRHPFVMKWKVGLDKNYKFTALEAKLYANAGWSMDLTKGVIERAVLHAENCYDFPNARIQGIPCRTSVASNTAFRGFGGPQGMFMAECYIYEIADQLGIEPDTLREINYLVPGVSSTPFKQAITEDFTVPDMVKQIKKQSNYDDLRRQVEEFNSKHKWIKRGLAHVPTMFGISFGATFLNQAGALVHIYHDGSILLTHGGTEMGQGLHTKMAMVCAEELKVPLSQVFISETSTNTVPNTSASAASASSDLNGMAVKHACDQLNERLAPYRERLGENATMEQLAHAAYFDRVNLSANGFYKTPDIGFVWGDPNPKPAFFYFTQGCAVAMVEVNTLTGDWSNLRTDIVMDIGRPINQAIDYGQIEGAFVQGQGLFTIEESLWLRNGALFTRGPGAYKIPGFRDIPQEFNVGHLRDRPFKHLKTIHRSKGIGEPPLFLGSSVFFAIRDALSYARRQNLGEATMPAGLVAPMTTERIRMLAGDSLYEHKGKIEPTEGDDKPFFVNA